MRGPGYEDSRGKAIGAVVLVLALAASQAVAEPLLRHEDPEQVRPELTKLVAVRRVPKGDGWTEEAREIRTYDRTGHILRHEHRKPDGSLVVSYDFAWDAAGRLTSRVYKDHTRRTERRDFSYSLDAQGRISARIMRDPSKPTGEYFRGEFLWRPDGTHDEVTWRHYPKEGPYHSHTAVFDAKGRLSRSCSEHSGCSMYEYDAKGTVFRVREQNRESHHYRVYEPTYDAAGKLASRTIGNVVEHYTWNAHGDVAEIVERIIATQGGAVRAKTIYTYTYR